ncbi:hypothetical protein MMC25_004963 [Agyrium rufum]|nr:hypothetical protein [Agyrium rufum]
MQYSLAVALFAAVVAAKPVALPQGVTAVITPTDGAAPAGCTPAFSGSFGIAVQSVATPAPAKVKRQAVTAISDGQPQVATMGAVSMIIDGQIQGAMHTMMVMPVAQISDGQPQGPVTMAPVTEYSDGQPQAPTISAVPVSESSDGQPEATVTVTTAPAVSESTDGQPEATSSVTTAPAVSQSTDGQPEASTSVPAVSQSTDGQPEASSTTAGAAAPTSSTVTVACASPGTLELTLADGVLKDGKGRTGYIASNFQFQFDDPPQAGALITAGFSVCGNGSLALGGSNTFYQCLSGNFYNLYNTNWAAQCSPVIINTLTLINCA